MVKEQSQKKQVHGQVMAPAVLVPVPVAETNGFDPWSRPFFLSVTNPAQSLGNALRKALN